MTPTFLEHLKAATRPWLGPALRAMGLRRAPPLRMPRVSYDDRLREEDVPNRVSIRADETLLVNGRPFFPNGLYYAEAEIADRSGAGLARLRRMGFNTVFLGGEVEDTEILDRIADAGLFVCYRPPGQLHGAFTALKEVVRRVGAHPALLAWEMDDEPILNRLSIADARLGCGLLRRIDPFHPIHCNQWWPGGAEADAVRRWAELADTYGFGVYPVPLERWRERRSRTNGDLPDSIVVVGAQVALWRTLAPGKPVIPALQAFAWDVLEDGARAFPTASESRFMAYHSVICGAKGLHHYGVPSAAAPCVPCGIPPAVHHDLRRTEDDFQRARAANERFWRGYRHVVRELAAMADVFTAPDATWSPLVRCGDAPRPAQQVQLRVKALGDGYVILAVNTSDCALRVTLQAAALAAKTLEVWGDRRSIRADAAGTFIDDFAPFGVRIYSDLPDRLVRITEGQDTWVSAT